MKTQTEATKFIDQILPSLDIAASELRITKLYAGQIGHLVLSPKEFVENEDAIADLEILEHSDSVSEDGDEEFIECLGKEYFAAISKNPHIFGLDQTKKPKCSYERSQYFRHSIYFEDPLFFTIKVPKAKKRFEIYDDNAEQFDVLTLGSFYVAFTEVDDCPKRIFIAHEFREQMRELLGSDGDVTRFRLGQIGPSPIHPRIYVVDVSNEEYDSAEIHTHEDDLYIIVNLSKIKVSAKELYEDVLRASAIDLDDFFHLSKWRSYLIDLHEAVTQKLQSLVHRYGKLGSNLFFVDFRQLSGLRKDLLMIHMSSITIESNITEYEAARKHFLGQTESSMFFDGFTDYFRRTSSHDVAVATAFFRTMEYMEKSISATDVAIRTIFAAIVGASIGMLATIFLK